MRPTSPKFTCITTFHKNYKHIHVLTVSAPVWYQVHAHHFPFQHRIVHLRSFNSTYVSWCMKEHLTYSCGKKCAVYSKNPTGCNWSRWCLICRARWFTKELGLELPNTFHLFLSKEVTHKICTLACLSTLSCKDHKHTRMPCMTNKCCLDLHVQFSFIRGRGIHSKHSRP